MFTDYPDAATHAAAARANFTVVADFGGSKGDEFDATVRYVSAEAKTGSRYAAFASPLPGPVEGGNPGTHYLVTLYSPRQASWVFGTYDDTTLDRHYVIEKLCDPAGLHHAGDIEAVCLLVGELLGVEVR